MPTLPKKSYNDYSLYELLELLVQKTKEIVESEEKHIHGTALRDLLRDIEEIKKAVELKKTQSHPK